MQNAMNIKPSHPSRAWLLLRAPERKRDAWRDLLALQARLDTPA